MQKLWDISPAVSGTSPVFPGDTRYTQTWAATLTESCPVNVASVTVSPHVGAHADAPLHYSPEGASVGHLDLEAYLGPCRVIHAIACRPVVQLKDVAHALTASLPPRVLFRTYAQMPEQAWDPDLPGLDPALLVHLADLGVRLVGTDSASVDSADSKTLDAHQVLRQRDLRVLENLVLDAVPEGDYELIALPLKWVHADASPVRAVLRPL